MFLLKKTTVLFLLLIAFSTLKSQSVSIFDINSDEFPLIKAKIYALDKDGNLVPNLTNNIILKDAGIIRNIQNLYCPPSKPPDAISSVLTIDVSGSMNGERIINAKAAARSWIDALPLGKSECAVTSFDHKNYLNQDFTKDRNRLFQAIETLSPSGGTCFNAGLLDPPAGALEIAKRGKYKRIIVFLTDGFASGNENAIVALANELEATIYVVTLGFPAPIVLKNIAERTGGKYFENITSQEEAELVYQNILQMAQGGEPCEIEWTTDGCPQARQVSVEIPSLAVTANSKYTAKIDVLPILFVEPSESIRFGGVAPSSSSIKSVTITAENQIVVIDKIQSNNPQFVLVNQLNYPFYLQPGESYDLYIRYTPLDSNYSFARIAIESNACRGSFLYCSGGFPFLNSPEPTIKLINPNGNELFSVGLDTSILWEGVTPADTVLLDYSTNKGVTWQLISSQASGLQHNWIVPNTPSESCLMRIRQYSGNTSESKTLPGHTFTVSNIALSPDARSIASVGDDRRFRVLDTYNNSEKLNLTSFLLYKACAWSKRGDRVAVSLSDYSILVLSPTDWSIVYLLLDGSNWNISLSFSPDGSLLAAGTTDGKIRIWDMNSGELVRTLNGHTKAIQEIKWNPFGDRLASISDDKKLILWNPFDGEQIYHKQVPARDDIGSIDFSPDGFRLAVAYSNNLIEIIDVESWQITLNQTSFNNIQRAIAWHPDGTKIASGTTTGEIIIWDPESQQVLSSFDAHSAAINQLEWSRNGNMLASCANDNKINLWFFNFVVQEDISDTLWTISLPEIIASDVDFGEVAVNFPKDSVLADFIVNIGKIPAKVDSIKVSGTNYSEFILVSGFPPFSVEVNSTKNIEFRFLPQSAGNKNAEINIYTPFDTLKHNISGVGVQQEISLLTGIIDFGKILIGTYKDTNAVIIKNTSKIPIEINDIKILGPDTVQFSISQVFEPIVLEPQDSLVFRLKFAPIDSGLTNGRIAFYFDGVSSPAIAHLYGEAYSNCGEAYFQVENFNDNQNFSLVGSAFVSANQLTLTSARENQNGAVWFKHLVPIADGFSTTFAFAMTDGYNSPMGDDSYPGADGIAFVIQNHSAKAIGLVGGGIGYEGIPNSLAIEFDTYSNDQNQIENKFDPNGNHLAIQSMGSQHNTATHSEEATLAINKEILEMRADGTIYYVKIEYNINPNQLAVYLDSTNEFLSPILVVNQIDLAQLLELANGNAAYIGLTAATGSSYETHNILNWEFCPVPGSGPIVSVNDFPQDIREILRIYPNPNQGFVNANLELDVDSFISLKVLNFKGQELLTLKEAFLAEGNHDFSFDLSNLSNSVYYLILSKNNQQFLHKFVISK